MVQSSLSMIDHLFLFQSNEDEVWAMITFFLPLKIKGASQNNFRTFKERKLLNLIKLG
jgi:hypothetical protein